MTLQHSVQNQGILALLLNKIEHQTVEMAHKSDAPHLPDNTSHLLSLLLCSLVSAKLSLGNLECTLVLPNLEQLSDALFIGSKSSNLPNQAPDEIHPLGRFLK
jgi:hypothetical protein